MLAAGREEVKTRVNARRRLAKSKPANKHVRSISENQKENSRYVFALFVLMTFLFVQLRRLTQLLYSFFSLGSYFKIIKVKLATIVEGDPKAPFSIATTPRCREGRYSFPWIAPLYP